MDLSEDEELPGISAGNFADFHSDRRIAMEPSEDGEELPGISSGSSAGNHDVLRSIGSSDQFDRQGSNEFELSSDSGVDPCELKVSDSESRVARATSFFLLARRYMQFLSACQP